MKRHWALAIAITGGCIYGGFGATDAARAQSPPLRAAISISPQVPSTSSSASPQAPSSPTPNDLFITAGKSIVVESSLPIERVSLGLGEFAEAMAVGPREILVNGKTPGETTLIVWQQGGGKLFFNVVVRPSKFASDNRAEALAQQISRELPGQRIDPSIENDTIFLRGTVKDMTSADRAMAIAGSMGKVVNLLYVEVPPPAVQILLKVKFASVDRSLLKQVGANLFSTGAANTIGQIGTGQVAAPTLGGGSGSSGGLTGKTGVSASVSDLLNLFLFRPDLNLGATIQALEQKNIVEVLAEPNVLAENGKQASFLAGGEFPYPVVQGGTGGSSTAVTIQFRQYGVRLTFIPTVTPRGTIRLQVAPEVSAIDTANGVSVAGTSVPGLTVRNVNTEVELAEGQSFALGGLLDNRETESFSKIPFIGDIPILGKFFQSKTKNRTNTELMVIVTPEIVHPMPAGQQIATPNFPVSFLPPNSTTPMSTPGQEVTGAATALTPSPIPLESLQQSMIERPLTVPSAGGNFGQGQASSAGNAAPAAPTK